NKMDRVGADFFNVVRMIREELGAQAVPLVLPSGAGETFTGIVDLIDMNFRVYHDETLGATFEDLPIPDDLLEPARAYREKMLEAISNYDDALMEKFLEDRVITPQELKQALRKATLSLSVVPVLCGAAFKNKGVQQVLDAVIDYLPCPTDRPFIIGIDPKNGKEIRRKTEPSEPLCALAFKTVFDQHGEVTFLRLYSGKLQVGKTVFNPRKEKTERVMRLFLMHANQRNQLEEAQAGEIVATMGLKYCGTGDTLTPKTHQILLEGMVFPEPVISLSIEPNSVKEKDELIGTLKILAKDDPTFTWRMDDETGQMIISGMGELHLEILKNRLIRDFKLNARVGKPRVAFKQTISEAATGRGVFQKMVGEKEMYAEVVLRVEPVEVERGVIFKNELTMDKVPRVHWSSIENAVHSAAVSGLSMGYSIINVKVTALDGVFDPQRSSDIAFGVATEMAFMDAMKKGKNVMLEPIMSFEVRSPREYLHALNQDLNARRARIFELQTDSDPVVIKGSVPLAKVFGYSTVIRSLSQGRASFSMEPDQYRPASPDLQAEN
ncbi:MAG: elongation factor G, partial [Planctomycetes bacterium]|nr:elongation factor G [Planctomycetota bacterium]